VDLHVTPFEPVAFDMAYRKEDGSVHEMQADIKAAGFLLPPREVSGVKWTRNVERRTVTSCGAGWAESGQSKA
jgi:hypothetical protein